MSMSSLVQALGAAAGGVSKGMDDAEAAAERKRRREQAEEDRAYTMSERARTTAERDRADKLRVDLGAAAAPVAVEQVQPAGPVMDGAAGAAGEAIPPVATVQRQSFESPAAAGVAAAGANTPQAVAMRQAAVANAAGDPVAALHLRTGAMQEQTAKLQLSAGERADLKAKFEAQINPLADFGQLGEFMSKSGADGQGGNLKMQFVPAPDGKSVTLNTVNPDGSLTPTARTFDNNGKGLAVAKAQLGGMPAEKLLEHFHREAVEARQLAQQQSTETHQRAMEKIAAGTAASTASYHAGMVKAAQTRADGANPGMTLADLKDGHKTVATTLNKDWETQIAAETDPAKLKAIKVARESEIATVQRLYTGAMSAGFGLTPEQAIVAFRSGETATQSFKSKDGKGTVKVDGVMYGGKFIPMADNPGAAPGAKGEAAADSAKPAAAAVKTAKAAPFVPAAIPVDPNSPKAPPAAPPAPGMAEQAGKAVKKIARASDGREWKNLAAGR